MRTSIIVVIYNHLHNVTIPFLKELEKTKGEYELILVDNGTDSTKEYINRQGKKDIVYIKAPGNIGYSRGNNLGYSKATGEYIVFMNADVAINDPLWLEKLQEKGGEGLIGGHLVTSNGLTEFRHRNTPYLNGWLVAGKRETFESMLLDGKVWDEGFFLYFEDVELSARAASKGIKLYEYTGLVDHLGSKSSTSDVVETHTPISKRHFTNRMMQMYLDKVKKKRIVFYFKSSYPFIDGDYEGKGVGGAEASLIQMAREFARRGWQTEIYNTTKTEGVFGGVEYHHVKNFRYWDYMDVFVLFREPYEYLPSVNAVTKLFWSCDQYTRGYWKDEIFPFVDRVICISDYHKRYVQARYGPLPDSFFKVIDLGVKIDDYKPVEKVPGKMIFCSVPRRGLELVPNLYKKIKDKVPHASLYITSDYTLWGAWADNDGFKQMFEAMPDVHFLGKVPRAELVKHQNQAELMLYPCTYEECFCISAMECIAAGAIPVTTEIGAVTTTVADSGVVLSSKPGTEEYATTFIHAAIELLTNPKKAEALRDKGRQRAKSHYNWQSIAATWLQEIDSIQTQGGEIMVECTVDGCGKKVSNGYTLAQHKAKFHTPKPEKVLTDIIDETGPRVQILRFTKPISVQINGKVFAGTEVPVEYEYVSAVMETVQNAYGSDALLI